MLFVSAQDEDFTAVRGALGVHLDGKDLDVPVGQTVTVPYGVDHTFWNADPTQDMETHVRGNLHLHLGGLPIDRLRKHCLGTEAQLCSMH